MTAVTIANVGHAVYFIVSYTYCTTGHRILHGVLAHAKWRHVTIRYDTTEGLTWSA